MDHDPVPTGVGMTDGGPTDGVAFDEFLFVVLCVVALVLAAALLPSYSLLGIGDGDLSEMGDQDGGDRSGNGGQGGGDGTGGSGQSAGETPEPGNGNESLPVTESENGGTARESDEQSNTSGNEGGESGQTGKPGTSLAHPSPQTDIAESLSIGPQDAREPPQKNPLFVVEGPREGYWRQSAYTTYSGTGWQRSTDYRELADGKTQLERSSEVAAEIEYEVTTLTEGTSLPTAWQPETIRLGEQERALVVSTVGGVRATSPLPEGTTYTASSVVPTRDPSILEDTGRVYPAEIERTYTQLPEGAPDRVERFTTELTAGADSPYEQATIVRDWLRTNKTYSTETNFESGEPIADQFIFEREKGFCQHFATTMTVMLRSQGIPARYVVGFAGGERIGENEYLVTSDRGHAWVEVYFPDVGWVRFDPTASRSASGDGGLAVENPLPPYDISLNRTAVAGATVTVSVQKNDSVVVGAPVYVEGERVGWTDAEGETTTRLPYVRNVTITARQPGSETKYDDPDQGGQRAIVSGGVSSPSATDPSLHYSLRTFQVTTPNGTDDSSETYAAMTNATVRVEGETTVGGTALVTAAVKDVPVRNGTVSLGSREVGRTDGNGTIELPLDTVSPGNHTITVWRDDVRGNATLSVQEPTDVTTTDTETAETSSLSISIETSLLPLPGGSATVTVTRAGEPIDNATVSGGSEGTVRTGPNGTAGIRLPFSDAVTLLATAPDGERASATVEGLFRNALAVLIGGIAVVLGIVAIARRLGITPRRIYRATVGTIRRGVRFAVAGALAASTLLVRIGRWLAGLPARLASNGLAVAARLHPRTIVVAIRRLLAGLLAALRSWAERSSPTERDGQGRSRRPAGDDGDSGPPSRIRELWREFVAVVRPPRLRTRTPGEIARYAIRRGLPERSVRYLTELYRDAEYGERRPGRDRLERAREAVATIKREGED